MICSYRNDVNIKFGWARKNFFRHPEALAAQRRASKDRSQATAPAAILGEDWIDQLYVLPEAQGRGLGTALLQVAQNAFDRLQLWTFQRNVQARRRYEARGFALIRQTDGAHNEEKEPDALYLWTRA
jgi:GNAT superfamily N-acetyltransferase